jgi:hypothetical protein
MFHYLEILPVALISIRNIQEQTTADFRKVAE